jgi:hypothetical protein
VPASERTQYGVALRKAAVLMIKTRGRCLGWLWWLPDESCARGIACVGEHAITIAAPRAWGWSAL